MIDVFQPLWLQSLYLLINSNSNKISPYFGNKNEPLGKTSAKPNLEKYSADIMEIAGKAGTLITCARINYKAGIFKHIRGVPCSTHASGAHGTKTILGNVV